MSVPIECPAIGPSADQQGFKLLGLCGSLRRQSRSRVLLDAVARLMDDPMRFQMFDGLGQLPLFNPDDESAPAPAVIALWAAVNDADAVVIASPEYAHGVTGTIKNALDWLVGYQPFANKPVALFNPSHRADHADQSMKEILRTMAADLIPDACLRIPVMACDLNAQQLSSSAPYRVLMTDALRAVERHLRRRSDPQQRLVDDSVDLKGSHLDAKEPA